MTLPSPRRLGVGDEHLPLGAGADEQEGDLRRIAQPLGGIEDVAEAMRHAVGADIADDEPAAEPPCLRKRLVARTRAVAGEIDAVPHHGDLLLGDAAGDEIVPDALGQRHDAAARR